MAIKYYLAGQTNFGNRGCEALVRSTEKIIHADNKNSLLFCPLSNINDAKQWPEANYSGVEFVPSPIFPRKLVWWGRLNKYLPLERIGMPDYDLDKETYRQIDTSDVVIMTGGDNITLDYGTLSLFRWCKLIDKAITMGKPAILWAASVGPFSGNPVIEQIMRKHLKRYSAITVRETHTLKYLQSIGIDNADLVSDPAFLLEPSELDLEEYGIDDNFQMNKEILGFNVSPLIRRFRKDKNSADSLDKDVREFIREVVNEYNLNIVLIPHVHSLDGSVHNSDWLYMKALISTIDNLKGKVVLIPPHLNACQLKYIIGKCKYFIGARTHATIAALSQSIPTVSIAYSMKAKGINEDIFGNEQYVLDTSIVDKENLIIYLKKLIKDQKDIKHHLAKILPEWKTRAHQSLKSLTSLPS